ncbi:hypothetical protein [Paraflavitalea sp. CAU 1676]|uniref:hypothetical protein n=1 Tax=Paraflavitalea sp. CAU 1676 TaxID=3032598 RepID=UPI0023DA46CA|nr:hypothetical protein [Paraflavitalea sp. CAU 1676]MDF2190626.1 hypothetical protein [Paraflavitalea sp. CAU 1676]
METIVLRAQIIYEIKSFTAMLQKGAPLPDLYATRDRIKTLMQQLDQIEASLSPRDPAPNN